MFLALETHATAAALQHVNTSRSLVIRASSDLINAAWSLTYLLVNLKRSLKAPRSPLNLALTASAVASSALYGSEYFWVIPGQEVVEEDGRP